jgi:large subunit ribosomal protein L23
MAFFDVFKKKEKETKKPVKKGRPEAKKKPVAKEAQKPVEAQQKGPKKVSVSEIGYRVLKAPQVTEKATDLLQKNQYVFKVFPKTNKTEIKRVLEESYGVDVESVRIINIPRKKRRLGRVQGWQEGYKKAIVKIKEGQKIEILPR